MAVLLCTKARTTRKFPFPAKMVWFEVNDMAWFPSITLGKLYYSNQLFFSLQNLIDLIIGNRLPDA